MTPKRVELRSFGGPGVIRVVEDQTLPEPGAGQVRIRVEASSLVFTDMLIRRNLYPVLKLTLPLTLGYDLVGHVDALGQGVTGIAVGDRVADLTQIGSNATHVVRPASGLVRVPPDLDATRAEPLILSYLTAYQALVREAEVPAGGKVLVYGASGAVGNAALDLCLALGLRAVGVASSRSRETVTAKGADFVAYDAPDAGAQLDRLSRERGGFDAVVDPARGEPLSRVLSRLAPRGRFVALGFSAPFRSAGGARNGIASIIGKVKFGLEFLRIKWLAARARQTRRVTFYDISERRAAHPDWFHDDLSTLFALLQEGRISPRIDRVFRLNEVRQAHEMLEAGGVQGRLVLDLRDA